MQMPILLLLTVACFVPSKATVFDGLIYKIRHGNCDGYLDAWNCKEKDQGQYTYVSNDFDHDGEYWRFVFDGGSGFYIQHLKTGCWLDAWDCQDVDKGQLVFLNSDSHQPGQHWRVGEGHDSLIWAWHDCRLDDYYCGAGDKGHHTYLTPRNDAYWGQVWSFEVQGQKYTLDTKITHFNYEEPDFSKLKGTKTFMGKQDVMACSNSSLKQAVHFEKDVEETNTLEFDVGMSLGVGVTCTIECDVPLLMSAQDQYSFTFETDVSKKTTHSVTKSHKVSIDTTVNVPAHNGDHCEGFFTLYESGSYSVDFTATAEVRAKETDNGKVIMDGDAIYAILRAKSGNVADWTKQDGMIVVTLHGRMSATIGLDSWYRCDPKSCNSQSVVV